jgi:quinol-cytochrome oxidoreductase complex cytochrome b subunit
MMAVAIVLLVVALILGLYEGWRRATTLIAVLSGAAIMAVSNLAANWPWFSSDLSSWPRTYGYGLLQTGVASFAIHVLPFIAAYLIGRRMRTRSG